VQVDHLLRSPEWQATKPAVVVVVNEKAGDRGYPGYCSGRAMQ